ncbi:MAG: hypothetical protein K0S61_4429 [Anaerocolumna sp.]|jgi:hypothetical protein|nr:hypothetical protein [Anaerocolumna sp.]
MKDELRGYLNLFIDNTIEAKNQFFWQETITKKLMALLYAGENKRLDGESIKDCHRLLKMNTGVFSMFRGNSAYNIATILSLKPDKERLIRNTLDIYDRMKAVKLRSSDYLAIAALIIATQTNEESYTNVIHRTKEFYEGMKSNHILITGGDDYIFCAMLGLSDIDTKTGSEKLEHLYQRLKPIFGGGDGLQGLTQILLLGGYTEESLYKVIELNNAFRSENLRLDKRETISSLGILALLPVHKNDIVTSVKEVFEFLRVQKGFGALSATKQEVIIYASAVASFPYMEAAKNSLVTGVLSTTVTNIILAQQAAMAAIVASSSVAAIASSSV